MTCQYRQRRRAVATPALTPRPVGEALPVEVARALLEALLRSGCPRPTSTSYETEISDHGERRFCSSRVRTALDAHHRQVDPRLEGSLLVLPGAGCPPDAPGIAHLLGRRRRRGAGLPHPLLPAGMALVRSRHGARARVRAGR